MASSFERVILGYRTHHLEIVSFHRDPISTHLLPADGASTIAVFHQEMTGTDLGGTSVGAVTHKVL